jgi:hypothetical protein
MRKPLAIVLVAAAAALIGFAGHKVYEFIASDKCLDSGGSWTYEEDECVR